MCGHVPRVARLRNPGGFLRLLTNPFHEDDMSELEQALATIARGADEIIKQEELAARLKLGRARPAPGAHRAPQ
jgi:hypothetical protein